MEQRRPSDRVLVVILVLIFVAGLGSLVLYVFTGQTTVNLFSNLFNICNGAESVKSIRMAIIRIDDIQAYSSEDLSIKMIEDAKELGVPLALGVIPKGMDDNTPIRRYLKTNLCWLEIAQHGWDHQGVTPETPEFRDVDFKTASADIMRGNKILQDLAEEKIVTFIPPLNVISLSAREAVLEAGMSIISSEGNSRFDYGARTFDFLTDTINTPETIISDCTLRIAETSICVVMVHPQDFTTTNVLDPVKYKVYLDTLTMLKADGYTFVRFKDLAWVD